MTNSRCNTAIRVLPVLGVLVLAATSWAQQRPPIVEKLAKTYGLDSFGPSRGDPLHLEPANSRALKLVSRHGPGSPRPARSPTRAKDKDGKPVKVTYLRSELSSQPDAVKDDIDPGFVNDNYWAALPLSCLLGHQRHRDR